MNTSLLSFNVYEDAPWRNISVLELRGMFDNFWYRCRKPLRVCCLTVCIPELTATAARPPLGRALREFRCGLITCGVDANFALFRLPEEGSKRSRRFRVLLFVDGNVIHSGEKLRKHFSKELEAQLSRQFSLVTLHEPPSFNSDGAMRVDENNFQIMLDWFHLCLQDAEYLYFGHTLPARRKKFKIYNKRAWATRKLSPRRVYAW